MTREQAELIAESTFTHAKGSNTLYKLDDVTFDSEQITARFTWKLNPNDMGHVCELRPDLITLQIEANHCF